MASRRQNTTSRKVEAQYEVLIGLSFGDEHHEAGKVTSNLPATSIAWLIEQGAIRPVADESEES